MTFFLSICALLYCSTFLHVSALNFSHYQPGQSSSILCSGPGLSVYIVTGKPFPNLLDVTTDDLVSGLRSGLFSSVDPVKVSAQDSSCAFHPSWAIKYAQAYLARIEEVNPILNVVTEVNPDALSIAAKFDAERKNGTTRG